MLDQQKDIDAVIVATPDHSHAVVALAAMQRGKHVYVQKPLAHYVNEARTLTEAARKYKVVTQMGNQGHSSDGARLIREWIDDGAIGPVHEVHAWTNRPVWPQGIEVGRPKETPPIPAGFDWDMWLGPAAYRPYHPTYHPAAWRAWWDFGTGSLGDLGLSRHGCSVLGPEVEVSDQRGRLHLDLLGRFLGGNQAEERAISALVDRALSIPGAGRDAAREAHLVGRWPDAAPARGTRGRPPDGRQRRRRPISRRERHLDVRLLLQQPQVDPGIENAGLSPAPEDHRPHSGRHGRA